MRAIYKTLEELKIPEKKEKMNPFVKKYIEEQKIEDEKIKSIINNTDYVEWLKKFTKDKDGFSDIEYIYCSDELEDSDRKNIKVLYLFYKGVERYASNNHIIPNYFDFGEFYKIKYNDFYFKIGIAYGQGNSFFCHKVTGKNLKGFINFNNILTNNSDNLDKLSNLVVAMVKSGIPTEDILNTVNAVVKNNNKKRVLTKQK